MEAYKDILNISEEDKSAGKSNERSDRDAHG